MEKKTPLYDCHVKSGGKMVPFAGYLMPIQYETGIIAEHRLVRTKAGLFDVSHMGEFLLTGKDALENIQNLVTNDCVAMENGQIKYSPMCNEQGGIVDDLMVHKMEENRYMLVVNASNREKDADWIKGRLKGDVLFIDFSEGTAEIALQGPAAAAVLQKLVKKEELPQKYYSCVENTTVGGVICIIAKTGYTGEDGYELYTDNQNAVRLWELLLETGAKEGLAPCGLGCRDTLRLEAAMPLYGHEMTDEISPIETGLTRYVGMNKEDFIGKKSLEERGTPKKKRVGIRITGRGIAREGYPVFQQGKQVGFVMSGSFCPTLDGAYATAFVNVDAAETGSRLDVEIRKSMVEAVVVPLPFYKKSQTKEK